MRHALVYHGSFELNYEQLAPAAKSYMGTDRVSRSLSKVAPAIDGVVVGYMERTGKKFSAVRLLFEDRDIILRNPVVLDPMRHMGNRRFSPRPVEIKDDVASVLLDDIIAQNPDQQDQLALLLNRVNQIRRGNRGTVG